MGGCLITNNITSRDRIAEGTIEPGREAQSPRIQGAIGFRRTKGWRLRFVVVPIRQLRSTFVADSRL
jgi:hypothetical protein